jgi:hypothetical protein
MAKYKTEVLLDMVNFFSEQGRVYKRSEYWRENPDILPVNPKTLKRYFGGKTYNTILKMAQKNFPVEWAAIGSAKVEEPVKVTPKKEPKAAEPDLTAESELSPLERLRAARGESSE